MQMSPLLGELADHQEKQVLLAAGCTTLDPSLALGSPCPGFSLPGLPSNSGSSPSLMPCHP